MRCHLVTDSPVALEASLRDPRFVTSVNPASSMRAFAWEARLPERQ